jgi:pimeloyl-ACP methyl ester carboxylesterase
MATKKNARAHADDLRAASRLVIDATTGVTDVVEQMHRTIASGPKLLGAPLRRPVSAVTGLVYGGIRGVTRAVGFAIDRVLAQLGPMLGASTPGAERLAMQAALNGVLGDLLVETKSPLALTMQLCRNGEPLELTRQALGTSFPRAGQQLLVLVHGSSMNDLQWRRLGHDHGRALEADEGFLVVSLRYNSGLHVSTNGASLAGLLEQLCSAWPSTLRSVTLVTHSMGGLVARAACVEAERRGHAWRKILKSLVFLGTPHHGAPLERGGNWVETLLGVSRYSAPLAALGKLRSAGVTDLRCGSVIDEHWRGRDRFRLGRDHRSPVPLPAGVDCFTVAASLSPKASKRPRGDGLVPVDSALGLSAKPGMTLGFGPSQQRVVYGCTHLDLLNRSDVYQALRGWLSTSR